MPFLLLLTFALQPAPSPTAAQDSARAAAAGSVRAAAAVPAQPVIEWAPLPRELPPALRDSVRFGYIDVPRDHADPDGARIRIAIAVLPARDPAPAPDPIVFIPGGPGIAGIATYAAPFARSPHFDLYRARRHVIIIDPRGHGYSEPSTCTELNGAVPLSIAGSMTAERAWLARLASCRERLLTGGVRLEILSAVQAAHDLEWLRRAVGASQLNLFGSSYGSRIAAEAMRQLPATIRAVHFSGPVPPARYRGVVESAVADEVLATFFRVCAAQPQCSTAYPRLEADFDSVMTRLRRAPVTVRVPTSVEPDGTVAIDDELLRLALSQLFLSRESATIAPALIHALARDGDILANVALPLLRALGDGQLAAGTRLAFLCNDGVIDRAADARAHQRCSAWLGATFTGDAAEPLRSDIPTLITVGELDPRTPPSYARFVAEGLSRAHVVQLPAQGHERPPDCGFRISRDFFDAPDVAPDTTCIAAIAPIEFLTGVAPSRRIGSIVARITARPDLAAIPVALGALLLAAGFVAGIDLARSVRPVGAHRHTRHQRWTLRGNVAAFAALLAAAFGLAALIVLAAAVLAARRQHPLLPLIGLPDGWWQAAALLLALALLAPAAAIILLRRSPPTGGSQREPPLL